MKPTAKQRQRIQRVVRKLHPEMLAKEVAALERYLEDAPNRRMQLMAFGAKVALQWATDSTQNPAPTRLLDWTQFALKLKRRAPPKTVPVMEEKQQRP